MFASPRAVTIGQVMTRSLRVAILGFSIGFLIAGLWGLTQAGNDRLASALFVPAGVGILVLGVFLLIDVRRHRHLMDLEDVDGPEFIPTYGPPPPLAWPAATDTTHASAAAATAATDAAAARIAELEARLAIEEQELDNVVHALGEADRVASAATDSSPTLAEVDSDAAEMEPLLRQEFLESLVGLAGREEDVIREFEELTTTGSAPARPAERRGAAKQRTAPKEPAASTNPAAPQRASSEQSQLQPVRRRRQPVKPKAPLDERAERVGKRDLRRGRAGHTQQVGRADEDG